MVSQSNSSVKNFPGFTTLLHCSNVQELLSRRSVEPEKFSGRTVFTSMFNDLSWRTKDNKKEDKSNAQLVSLSLRLDLEGQWSFFFFFLDVVQRSGTLVVRTVHKENGTDLQSK